MNNIVEQVEFQPRDWNLMLWLVMILSLCVVINIVLNSIKSKKVKIIILILALLCITAVSICWTYFSFWRT